MDGEDITGATVFSEMKEISNGSIKSIYIRWTNYVIKNSGIVVTQKIHKW